MGSLKVTVTATGSEGVELNVSPGTTIQEAISEARMDPSRIESVSYNGDIEHDLTREVANNASIFIAKSYKAGRL